jgi:hypothetical protein
MVDRRQSLPRGIRHHYRDRGNWGRYFTASIRDVRSVRHIQSASSKRMLGLWNRDEYFQLPNRAQTGASPMVAYFSKQIGGAVLYLWPIPTADVDIELDYNRSFYFAEGPEQELDIPPEWHEAVLVRPGLALGGHFRHDAAGSGQGLPLRYAGQDFL